MSLIDFLLRLVFWCSLPILLFVLAIGPARFMKITRRWWSILLQRRLEPEQILTQVVRQHEKHVASLRSALKQAEVAEADIVRNVEHSRQNIENLDSEARGFAARGDDLGARAALYKLNLERLALTSFEDHLSRQRQLIDESRRRLYQLELQLRQYEVGRSILLSQLAEARSTEDQYRIASQFDPFNAVANWQRAEGMVQEQSLTAHAAHRVHTDTAEFAIANQSTEVDPAVLEKQLADLKAEIGSDGSSDPAVLKMPKSHGAKSKEPRH